MTSGECRIIKHGDTRLAEIRDIMINSDDKHLFVFDYDDTLVTKYYKLSNRQKELYDGEIHSIYQTIPYQGFNDIVELSKTKSVVVLTKRHQKAVDCVVEHLNNVKAKALVVGTININRKSVPKGEVLLDLVKQNTKFETIHFMDDLDDNLESVCYNFASKEIGRFIELNVYRSSDKYLK